MLKVIRLFLSCLSILLFASTSWSLSIYDAVNDSYIDVGDLDTWVASENLPKDSNPSSELDFVNRSIFGENYLTDGSTYFTEYEKYDFTPNYYTVIGSTDTYAFELMNEPEYFLIKFGDANDQYVSHIIWSNTSELDWGVVDLTGLNVLNISAFSHWGEVGGTSPVPEPATMLLLGTGLVGIAGIGRKKKKK